MKSQIQNSFLTPFAFFGIGAIPPSQYFDETLCYIFPVTQGFLFLMRIFRIRESIGIAESG
jgi:hypothetical protein